MLRAFVPVLRARGGGVIVNMISSIGQVPSNKAIYSAASCSALTTVTQGLAHDLSLSNIRIVGINSWVVNTERNVAAFSERAQDRLGDAKRWPELHANLPFKRAAEPSEVGDLVAFITSSRASYLSGQVISRRWVCREQSANNGFGRLSTRMRSAVPTVLLSLFAKTLK
jgi:NAD(P)-dependent dehydrogenase (short-subunit alcohol dehydrogenase family)